MGMRATTLRFSEDLWVLVEREAGLQGISAAQFVRDAALLRAAALMGARGEEDAIRDVEAVARGGLRPTPEPAPADPPEPVLSGPERLALLVRTGLMEGERDAVLDGIAGAARRVVRVPVALVSLVDHERQVFACALGLPEPWATTRETALSHSFCRHAVVRRAALVVEDARRHPDLRHNLAIRDLGVVAYLGIPLATSDGTVLGTLCVIDHEARRWTAQEVELVSDLATAAAAHLERRIALAA
jgi:GAF domain-containing protein